MWKSDQSTQRHKRYEAGGDDPHQLGPVPVTVLDCESALRGGQLQALVPGESLGLFAEILLGRIFRQPLARPLDVVMANPFLMPGVR